MCIGKWRARDSIASFFSNLHCYNHMPKPPTLSRTPPNTTPDSALSSLSWPLHLMIPLHSLLIRRRHFILATCTRPCLPLRLHKALLLTSRELRIRRAAVHRAITLLLLRSRPFCTRRPGSVLRLPLLHVIVCHAAVAAALRVLLHDFVVGRVWGDRDDVPGM